LFQLLSKAGKPQSYKPKIFKKFPGHIKKVGSYYGSLKKITSCACNAKYQTLFSHMEVHKLDPSVKTEQSIPSWEDVIKEFIADHEKYKNFKDLCLDDDIKGDNLRRVYGTDMQMDSAFQQTVKLHAEMNLLTKILINEDDKSRSFIVVSKKYRYLCDLYIRFARTKGYVIDISGTQKDISFMEISGNR
jgi:hypothetical protein